MVDVPVHVGRLGLSLSEPKDLPMDKLEGSVPAPVATQAAQFSQDHSRGPLQGGDHNANQAARDQKVKPQDRRTVPDNRPAATKGFTHVPLPVIQPVALRAPAQNELGGGSQRRNTSGGDHVKEHQVRRSEATYQDDWVKEKQTGLRSRPSATDHTSSGEWTYQTALAESTLPDSNNHQSESEYSHSTTPAHNHPIPLPEVHLLHPTPSQVFSTIPLGQPLDPHSTNSGFITPPLRSPCSPNRPQSNEVDIGVVSVHGSLGYLPSVHSGVTFGGSEVSGGGGGVPSTIPAPTSQSEGYTPIQDFPMESDDQSDRRTGQSDELPGRYGDNRNVGTDTGKSSLSEFHDHLTVPPPQVSNIHRESGAYSDIANTATAIRAGRDPSAEPNRGEQSETSSTKNKGRAGQGYTRTWNSRTGSWGTGEGELKLEGVSRGTQHWGESAREREKESRSASGGSGDRGGSGGVGSSRTKVSMGV